ncbi:MAG: tail fiber domain-containing protein [Bacteroidales bacterium]|nr:tail fiber domain-containing protein [Bacteroidales bacterium]MBN2749598.1 tail fiber domain-containing protein [Bacteroidales bacterium]
MRKIFLLVATILFALLVMGQPKGFNYQAAIRTSEGEPIASKQITVRISLQDELQNPYYTEQHSITTNEFGVFSITIGEGSPTSGSFESIPWQATSIYLQTEVDEENNGSFVSIGQATKLQTVPYALFAQNATQGDTGNGIESVSFNPTGTLTFIFTNGATYTTPSLIGPQGPAGTGLNLKGGWITGTSYTAGDYVFAPSTATPTINSMWICQSSSAFTSTLQPKDDSTNWVEFSAPKGEQGEPGPQGETGPQGPAGTGLNPKGSWVSGTTYTAGDYVFASSVTDPAINSMWICQSSTSITSTVEPKNDQANWVEFSAPKGEDGIGITSTVDNGNGTLTFTYSDGSTFTTSDLTGPVTNGALGQTLRHNGTTWVATSNLYNPGDKVEVVSDPNLIEETPIFAVKNKLGQTVFAVFQSGVRVYVEDAATKGAKGGFAIGGITNQTKQEIEYFRITPDSARIYINQTPTGTKGAKGGFAIGGITNQTKGVTSQNLFFIAPDSARIYIKDEVGVKGAKGGFAIGGITNQTKSTTNNYLYVHRDSTRVYINDAPTKGAKGGFAIGGITNQTKGGTASFFDVATSTTGTVTPSQKRVLWYPIKNAFLAGRVLIESPDSVGENSFATGFESKSKGIYSQAMGYMAIARGSYSTAIGKNAIAQSDNSFAFGYEAIASGNGAFALGNKSKATGLGSFALGFEGTDSLNLPTGSTIASGDYSIAFGMGAKALKKGALAIGTKAEANYEYSQSFGYSTKADNWYATAVGYKSRATGLYSSAFGFKSFASGEASVALGMGSAAGKLSMAIGDSHAGGLKSFSMGSASVATGHASVAMGFENSAVGEASVALGLSTLANGNNSLSAGYATIANSESSTALGFWNIGVIAGPDYPITDPNYNTIFEVGNGAYESRRNALTVFKNGSAVIGSHNAELIEYEIAADDGIKHSLVIVGEPATARALYVKGVSQFEGSIIPTTSTSDLGGTSNHWRSIYANYFYGDGGATRFEASILPTTSGTRNLGSTTYRWNYLYANSLNINGTSYFNSSIGVGATNTDTSIPIKLSSSSTSRTALTLENPSSSNVYVLQTVGSAIPTRAGNFEIWNTGLSIASFTITSNGRVGIGTSTAPDDKFVVVNGSATGRYTTSGWTHSSDIRLKQNIEKLGNVLPSIKQLQGVTFNFKNDPQNISQIGFIAQDVEKLFPQLVTTDSNGFKSIAYGQVSAVLVETIKEQQNIIETQQEEIDALKQRVLELEKLKAEIEQIKSLITK